MEMQAAQAPRDVYDMLFRIGMIWRIVYGTFRIVLGLGLLRIIGVSLADLFYRAMEYEIAERPRDFLLHTVGAFLSHHPYTVTYFLAAYLIFWGTMDAILSLCLLYQVSWAYPVSMYLISFFVSYEVYRYFHTHSLILLTMIVLDIGIVFLIGKEYRRRFRKLSSVDVV